MRQQCYLGVHGSRGGADPGAAMVSNWRQWRQLASRAAAAFCPARALCATAGASFAVSGGGAAPASPAVSNWRQWRQLAVRIAASSPTNKATKYSLMILVIINSCTNVIIRC